MTTEHGQENADDTVRPHRWQRAKGEDGVVRHWCIDGDTGHHVEPCGDAATMTGDHASDTTPTDLVPLWSAP